MILPCRNPVHLYRSLLREAKYLFDPAAQVFHTEHIRWSFRRQRVKQGGLHRRADTDGAAVLVSQRESQQLKRARQYLRMLQRANQGYVTAVKHVLRSTYAREGKQRRALLKEIMLPPSHADLMLPAPPPKYHQHWRPPEKFTDLLKNQHAVQSFVDRRKKRFRPIPEIPAKNKSNRPFPTCRIKGIMQEWYARHADLLMPPLQETQWLQIYQSVTNSPGKSHFKIPQRRPIASAPVFTRVKNNDLSTEWISKIDDLIRTAPQRPLYSKSHRAAIGNPHHMTSRFLRRMMQHHVLGSAVTVIVDPKTGKSAFRRAPAVKPPSIPATCTASQQASLFD